MPPSAVRRLLRRLARGSAPGGEARGAPGGAIRTGAGAVLVLALSLGTAAAALPAGGVAEAGDGGGAVAVGGAADRAEARGSGTARVVPQAAVRRVSATAAPSLLVPRPLAAPVPMPGERGGMTDAPLPAAPAVAAPLSTAATEAEVGRLRAEMAAEVPGMIRHSPESDRRWIALLRPMLSGENAPTHPQLVVEVDRNVRVQQAAVVMVRPNGPWEVVGATHVSTGQMGRWDHYITPTGVFPHTDLILDYRAEGTFNENHVRGLGVKGMRVWDFGWQWAHRGWGEDGSPIQIRLEMHATDPAVLAQRIGHTASQGCVRIPEALNRFLDHRGVLDADYERAAVDDIRFRALLPRDREPTPLAGDMLVVVDSGA